MKALYVVEKGKLEFRDLDVPRPGPGEVQVRVRACGVCGSDVHYFKEGGIGAAAVRQPMILGHEVAGDVTEVGPGVENLTVGARVAVEPQIPCGRCVFCRSGSYNRCPDVRFRATPPVDGALAEFIVVPEAFAFPLPDDLTYEEGAMIEPLSCALSACRKARLSIGHFAVVLGIGPVGLLTVACARVAGVTSIVACDLLENRLALARDFGASRTVLIDREDPIAVVRDMTAGLGADVVFETAGPAAAKRLSIELLRSGGVAVWLGFGPNDVPIPANTVVRGELRIIGNRRYAHTYPAAIDLVAHRRIDLNPCITHRFHFDRADDAVRFAAQGDPDTIKVIITID